MPATFCHSFDRRADAYEAHAAVQAHAAAALAALVPPEARAGDAVEFGAGTGLLTRALAPWRGVYRATDLSPRMAALGRARCPFARWDVADARTFAPPRETRWILSSSMLQWIDDPEALFARWRQAAPRARLALSLFAEGTLAEWNAALGVDAAPLRWRTAAQWRAFLERAGWRVDVARAETLCVRFASPLALLQTLKATGTTAPKARVSGAALRAAIARYAARFPDGDGCRSTWQIWRATATALPAL